MKRWLALLLVLVLCLALAACGDDKKSKDDDDEDEDDGEVVSTTAEGEGEGDDWGELLNPVTPATRTLPNVDASVAPTTTTTLPTTTTTLPTTTTTLPTAAPTASADNSSVAAFVARYKADVEAMSTDQMVMSLEARGTAIVYLYAYTTIYDATQELQNSLRQGMEAQSSTLATALTGMQSECPAITSLIYEYYTADGDLILSYEYK